MSNQALDELLDLLTPKQASAVMAVVSIEIDGLNLSDFLKTPYSCPACGFVAGKGGQPRADRLAILKEHKTACPDHTAGVKRAFISTSANYYNKWLKNHKFIKALKEARKQARQQSLENAGHRLQLHTSPAVAELYRQVREGKTDGDKRAAAIAILDRADLSTAPIQNDGLSQWLADLRSAADEGEA